LFWLVLVCALALLWWRESQGRKDAEMNFARAKRAVLDMGQWSGMGMESREGDACPDCGGTLAIVSFFDRTKAISRDGTEINAFRQVGICQACKGRFGYLMSDYDEGPNFRKWLPIKE
jgi:hypothetical protein